MTTLPVLPDFRVVNLGTIVTFTPISGIAQAWADENVDTPGWAFMGNTICCDHRMAQPILDAIVAEGFVVEGR